ncbi:flagellin [Parendozoicomonas haliclonae]|uniref:Flagellin n=1 Tax=Parendozoicomonas haliclonae TaxID=1960125 RepID=A0A1X7AGY7_9GAMM|nr:flagellin [Parendozoicomonas haliclonae]SMA39868.1 B-type flagellin [Parendozoicomonas haliclonae]
MSSFSVNTNIFSLNAQRNLSTSGMGLQNAMQRLSSGFRINSAKDDAAGLQIANKLTSQIRGLGVAIRNANDGISLAQTAEGALQESTNILQRMRELSLQSANGSNSAEQRAALNAEVTQLKTELTRIAETTSFGGQKLLTGDYSESFQIGANTTANDRIDVSIGSAKAADLTGEVTAASTTAYAFDDIELAGVTIADQTLTFDVDGTDTDVTISSASSAKDVSDAIGTNVTGLTAAASTEGTLTLSDLDNVDNTGEDVTISIAGVEVTEAYATSAAATTTALVTKINGATAQAAFGVAGVTVSATESSGDIVITFSNTDGANIDLKVASDSTAGGTGTDAITAAYDVQNGGTSVATGSVTIGTDPADLSGATAYTAKGNVALTVTGTVLSYESTDNLASGTVTATATTTPGTTSEQAVSTVDISTLTGAQNAVSIIDGALQAIDNQRADLGAIQNRLTSTISNLSNISENVSASRSRIMDADFAAETANLAKYQVLQQAGTAILAQANQSSQNVLSLLR